MEFGGKVEAIDAAVTEFKVADEVFGVMARAANPRPPSPKDRLSRGPSSARGEV